MFLCIMARLQLARHRTVQQLEQRHYSSLESCCLLLNRSGAHRGCGVGSSNHWVDTTYIQELAHLILLVSRAASGAETEYLHPPGPSLRHLRDCSCRLWPFNYCSLRFKPTIKLSAFLRSLGTYSSRLAMLSSYTLDYIMSSRTTAAVC